MASIRNLDLVSPEEYLGRETGTPPKHEFVDGHVYRVPEERNLHHVIAGNVMAHLHRRVRPRGCRACTPQTIIRVRYGDRLRFYYPDVSVICRFNPPDQAFQDEPAAIFEVLSVRTRRIDRCEKHDAYLMISALRIYGLVDQEAASLTIYRRVEDGFAREEYDGLQMVIPLPELGTELPLAEIYEDVDFLPEADDCDE